MKVVIVNSGHPAYTYGLAKGLKKIGVDIQVLVSKGQLYKECFDGSFPIYEFDRNDSYLVKVRKLVMFIKNFNPEVIHFQATFSLIKDSIFSFFLKYLRAKIVYTVHNILPHEKKIYDKFFFNIIYKNLPRIIVHANENKIRLIKEFNLPPNKISVIRM
ncbi:MAG: glycosyltransferase family 4 protein, partial [Candidatus Omnitrophica bacterium]|nr:glycosyltransferase family 4 protein [Candidatus Omnitrophota bacterium]